MTEPDPIAALAAQLEELRGQVGALRALHSTDYGQVMVLLLEVKKLGEKIDDAVARRQIEEPQAPYLLGLPADEYAAELVEVRAWIERVASVQYPTYFAKLPPCWASHTDLVLELDNMMTEWVRIYGDPDNRPFQDALWFHERWLPGFLSRCEKWFRCDVSGCLLARTLPWERSPPRYT